MPRRRPRSPMDSGGRQERPSELEDDDFLFDDTQSLSGSGTQEPQHRHAANARERARMRVLSKAFCRLKTTLPWVPADTKLSKLDTLRLAASYIAHLRTLLQLEPAAGAVPHPLNLAWPFAFQHNTTAVSSTSTSPRASWTPGRPHQAVRNRSNSPRKEELSNNRSASNEESNVKQNNFNYENVNCLNNNYEVAGNTHCNMNVQYYYAYKDNRTSHSVIYDYEDTGTRTNYCDDVLNNIH